MLRLVAPVLAAIALSAQAAAEPPRVVTDTPVVHSLVAQVMGDLGPPALLLDRGADPHAFQLRPSQAQALASADLVFWVGPELTPWLERALAGPGADARAIALLHVAGTTLRRHGDPHGEDHHSHKGDDEPHGADHHDHGHNEPHGEDPHADGDGHDHSGTDAHAWLSPDNARAWIDAAADALAAADPANAAVYAANAEAAAADVNAAEAAAAALLDGMHATPLVFYHDAYGYLADRFGLTVLGTIAAGDAADPGAAHLARLRAELAAAGDACVFPEAGQSRAYVDAVAEGTAARIGQPLDPHGSLLDPGPGLFAALLVGLAEAIGSCTDR